MRERNFECLNFPVLTFWHLFILTSCINYIWELTNKFLSNYIPESRFFSLKDLEDKSPEWNIAITGMEQKTVTVSHFKFKIFIGISVWFQWKKFQLDYFPVVLLNVCGCHKDVKSKFEEIVFWVNLLSLRSWPGPSSLCKSVETSSNLLGLRFTTQRNSMCMENLVGLVKLNHNTEIFTEILFLSRQKC